MPRFLMPWVALLLCLLHGSARAQESDAKALKPEQSERQARELFYTGVEHSRVERWADAALAFEASAALVPRPSTLQNLVAALRRLNRAEEAIAAIDRYLSLAHEPQYADTRGQLEEARRVLQEGLDRARAPAASVQPAAAPTTPGLARAETSAQSADAPPAARTPPQSSHAASQARPIRGERHHRLAWLSLGSSALLAASAGALLISTELEANRWRDRCEAQDCSKQQLAAPQTRIDRRDRAGYALTGVAVVTAASAAAIFWFDWRAERKHLSVGLGPAGTSLRLRF